MKVTKNKLKQLIKEQYETAMLQEQSAIPKNVSMADARAYAQGLKNQMDNNPSFIRADLKDLEARVKDLEQLVNRMTKLMRIRSAADRLFRPRGPANTNMEKRVDEGVRPDVFQEVMDELE